MFESDKKSPLDRLRKGLYSRNVPDTGPVRHSIHGEQVRVPESWDVPSAEPLPVITPERRYAYKLTFLFSALFLVIACAVAAFTFFGGGNFVSVDNVDIQISGPATIGGGEPLSLDVAVQNNNKTDIQLVDLIAEYPQGTKDPANPSKDLSRVRTTLGDISSRSVAQQSLSSLMFGQQGDVRDIKFTAEYRTADSNAIFFKEKVYHVTISSSPVLVSLDALDTALPGEPLDVTITVASNTTAPVKNLLVTLNYPFGFSVVSSDPKATYSDNIWNIGDLAPGAKRSIKLRASVSGQDTEQRTIHASVGIQSATNEREIATTIIAMDHTFTIEKPFLGLDLTLDGGHADLAAEAGHPVRADIIWTNNSDAQITNARIVATLGGNVLDRNSVSVEDDGFYDSAANTITWQAGRTAGLDTVAPGGNGRVSFSVSPVRSAPGQSAVNPQITIAVSASGDRVDQTGAPQTITTAVSRAIKLATNLSVSARALYSQGPFKNSGPVPPRVDQETTYTVVWTVTNTSNTITGAKVSATLPPSVSWMSAITPTDADISYDAQTGIVSWNVGEVPRNADIGSGARQAAFQIKLKPSANQAGAAASLMGQTAISGTDVFTGALIQNAAPALSTSITTDLLYKSGDDIVQK